MDHLLILADLKKIESILKNKGLHAEVAFCLNYVGSDTWLKIEARETERWKGPASTFSETLWDRSFVRENVEDLEETLIEANAWAYSLPDEVERAAEMQLRVIHKLIDSLPAGNSEIAVKLFGQLADVLRAEADRVSHNVLPRA